MEEAGSVDIVPKIPRIDLKKEFRKEVISWLLILFLVGLVCFWRGSLQQCHDLGGVAVSDGNFWQKYLYGKCVSYEHKQKVMFAPNGSYSIVAMNDTTSELDYFLGLNNVSE